VHLVVAWVAGSIGAAYLIGFSAQLVIVKLAGVVVNLLGVAFVYGIVATTVGCVLVSIGVGPRPRARRDIVVAGVMGALTALAPIALVVFMRLSLHTCTVVNVLGLPAPSVAVIVIVYVPTPTTVPASGVCVTVTGPQLSLAVVPATKLGIVA
jgi:hypothetical protein